MKTLKITAITLMIMIATFSCEEKLTVEDRSILVLEIYSEATGEPAANAQVVAYGSLDDWAFDERRIEEFTSNADGEVILKNYPEGEYYFDVVKGDLNNWQTPYASFVEDGEITYSGQWISYTINGVVSNKDWRISRVYDQRGADIAQYACMTDNIVTFTKAGAYEMRDMANDCDSIADFFEASWWGGGIDYIGLVLEGGSGFIDLYVSELTDNRFVATQYLDDGSEINYVYELN